jgi:hypothetical protein
MRSHFKERAERDGFLPHVPIGFSPAQITSTAGTSPTTRIQYVARVSSHLTFGDKIGSCEYFSRFKRLARTQAPEINSIF